MRNAKIFATTIAIVGLLTLAPGAAYGRTSVGSDYRIAADSCGEQGNHDGNHQNSDTSCSDQDKAKADKAEADEDASGAPDTDNDAEDQAEKADQDKADKAKADKAEADEDASGAPDTDNDAEDQAEKASGGQSSGSNGNGTAVRGFESAPNGNAVGAVTPIVQLPGGSNQLPANAVQGVQPSPVAGVQSLPSTSTDGTPAVPLAALGLAMMALGGVLLRRRDAQS